MPINEDVIDALAALMDEFVTDWPEADLTAENLEDYALDTRCLACHQMWRVQTGEITLAGAFERIWASEVWRAFVARLEARGRG